MKLTELNTPNNTTSQILTEGYQTLTETQKIYLNRWEKELWPLLEEYTRLAEAQLTVDQINSIFQGAEQRAMASGDNKTVAGKVGGAAAAVAKLPVDIAKKVDAKINELGKLAQNAGPVQNADAKFEELKKKIGDSDSKVAAGVKKISDWAKENPKKASLAVGILTAIAAFAGGPVGGAAAGLILRSTKELLQGEKLSSAIGKSVKTAAYGAIAGWAMNGIGDWLEGLRFDAVPYEKAPGLTTLEVGFTETFTAPGVTMKDTIGSMIVPEDQVGTFQALVDKIADATASTGSTSDPAALDAFAELRNFVDTFDTKEFIADMNLTNEVAQEIAAENDAFLQALTQVNSGIAAVAQGTVQGKIDAKDVKVGGEPVQGELDLQGGGEKKEESIDYETSYKYLLEQYIAEADPAQGELPLDNPNSMGAKMKRGLGKAASAVGGAVKGAAGKAAAGVKQVGKDLGNKVTANKLMKAWKAKGEPTEAGDIVDILQDAGMSADDIKAIGQDQKVELPVNSAQDTAQDTAQAGDNAQDTAQGSGQQSTDGDASKTDDAQAGGSAPTASKGERRATKDEIAKWVKKDAGLVDPKNPAADGDIEANRDGRNIGLIRQANGQDHIWLGASWVDMATGKSVSADTQGLGRPDLEELAKQIQKANIAKLVKDQLTSPGVQAGTKQAQAAKPVTKSMTSKQAQAQPVPGGPKPGTRFQKNV